MISRSPSRPSISRTEADVAQPLARVVESQTAPLGERGGHRLDAVLQDAVEDTASADADRKVGEPADVAVERCGILRHGRRRGGGRGGGRPRPRPRWSGSIGWPSRPSSGIGARPPRPRGPRQPVPGARTARGSSRTPTGRRARAAGPPCAPPRAGARRCRGGRRRRRRASCRPRRCRCAPARGSRAPPARAASEAPPAPGSERRPRARRSFLMTGSSSTRSAIFWLATPRRIRFGRSCSWKKARTRSASPSTSTTSPSWKRPGPSVSVAARTSAGELPLENSAAARKPGSMSSPTTERVFESRSPIP